MNIDTDRNSVAYRLHSLETKSHINHHRIKDLEQAIKPKLVEDSEPKRVRTSNEGTLSLGYTPTTTELKEDELPLMGYNTALFIPCNRLEANALQSAIGSFGYHNSKYHFKSCYNKDVEVLVIMQFNMWEAE